MDARVRRLSDFVPLPRGEAAWGLEALRGRFVELSGARATAVLTAAFGVVLEAQRRGEIVAWVSLPRGAFFPPDAAGGGVDLDALAVVRVPDAAAAARAADQLVRSGGFGLVVLDLAGGAAGPARLPAPLQSRLNGLAQKHDAAVLALTEKSSERASLSSLVSLRAEASREEGACVVRVLKDKRRGPGHAQVEACRPPAGLHGGAGSVAPMCAAGHGDMGREPGSAGRRATSAGASRGRKAPAPR